MTFFSIAKFCFLWTLFLAGLGQSTLRSHYVALRGMGQPKYQKNFSHFEYANPKAPKGGNLNLATSTRFNTLHAYGEQGLPAPYLELVFATLMKPARDNMEAAYPYVAEGVEVDSEYKSVTFHLRKQAFFHNGEPITAEDVAFSFEVLKKEGKMAWRVPLQQVGRVEIVNPYTVKFVFVSSNRDLPYLLGSLPIFCKKSLEGQEWLKQPQLVGSGPYKIQSYDMGKFIVYERVKNWWGEKLPCHKGFYNFDKIKVTYYADTRVGFEAFKKGLVDWWKDERISNWYKGYDFPACQSGQVIRATFKKPFYHGLTGLFMNTRRPYLSDIRVRKALSILFDFEWLNKARFFNSYKRNASIFMNSGYGAPVGKETKQRPLRERERLSQALTLLSEAGWVLKDGKLVSKKTGQPMVLELAVYAPGHVALFQHFLGTLKKVGIEGHIKGADMSHYTASLRTLDFDLILHFHPHVVMPGPEQELFWGSQWADKPSTFNLAGVKDPVVDDLVSKIKKASSLKELKDYTALLDRIITLGYYLIPGWSPQSSYLAYWRKINVLHKDASLYEIDTLWARSLEQEAF